MPQEMAAQGLLLPSFSGWSLAGDPGLDSGEDREILSSVRTTFQPPLTCHLPSVSLVGMRRSPSASRSGHATKCLSPRQLSA